MATTRYSVAASGQVRGDVARQPAGEAHAWLPGTNQTVCGVPLAKAGLRRFPHVPWEYRSSDALTEDDEIRHLCERCLAATRPRGDHGRSWVRTSPRP